MTGGRESEKIGVGEFGLEADGGGRAGGWRGDCAVLDIHDLDGERVAALEDEAVERDIARGGLDEAPVFEVEEKFHAAAERRVSNQLAEWVGGFFTTEGTEGLRPKFFRSVVDRFSFGGSSIDSQAASRASIQGKIIDN